MSEAAEKLKADLLALPANVRLELADFLYDSVPEAGDNGAEMTQEEWDNELLAELERRAAEVKDGVPPGRPLDVVMRELKERFG